MIVYQLTEFCPGSYGDPQEDMAEAMLGGNMLFSSFEAAQRYAESNMESPIAWKETSDMTLEGEHTSEDGPIYTRFRIIPTDILN